MSRRKADGKRNFSQVTLKEAISLVPASDFTDWQIAAPPRLPGIYLQEALPRFKYFDIVGTEAAKLLLIDALLAEIVPEFKNLKIWKSMALSSAIMTGVADYLIAPTFAYMKMPLLCAVEAKRDDFEQGRTQRLAEMIACRENNKADGYDKDVFGIVSNGQGWQFYKLALTATVYETGLYTTNSLPELLGALVFLFGEVAAIARRS